MPQSENSSPVDPTTAAYLGMAMLSVGAAFYTSSISVGVMVFGGGVAVIALLDRVCGK
jgi:hypothetical protein